MDSERMAGVLQVALASYDRKELRVQQQYLEEQDAALECTCFRSGAKLLRELRQAEKYDVVVLCSELEDMSGMEFVLRLRQLDHKPLLLLFDEGRRRNGTAFYPVGSEDFCCVERTELKKLLQELYRMPGQHGRQVRQQCEQLYSQWEVQLPDINCSYLTSAVCTVYGTSQKMAIRKEVLQAVGEQYGISVSAVDSGIRRLVDQLEARPAPAWNRFKQESGFASEKPTTGKLIYAIKNHLLQQVPKE